MTPAKAKARGEGEGRGSGEEGARAATKRPMDRVVERYKKEKGIKTAAAKPAAKKK